MPRLRNRTENASGIYWALCASLLTIGACHGSIGQPAGSGETPDDPQRFGQHACTADELICTNDPDAVQACRCPEDGPDVRRPTYQDAGDEHDAGGAEGEHDAVGAEDEHDAVGAQNEVEPGGAEGETATGAAENATEAGGADGENNAGSSQDEPGTSGCLHTDGVTYQPGDVRCNGYNRQIRCKPDGTWLAGYRCEAKGGVCEELTANAAGQFFTTCADGTPDQTEEDNPDSGTEYCEGTQGTMRWGTSGNCWADLSNVRRLKLSFTTEVQSEDSLWGGSKKVICKREGARLILKSYQDIGSCREGCEADTNVSFGFGSPAHGDFICYYNLPSTHYGETSTATAANRDCHYTSGPASASPFIAGSSGKLQDLKVTCTRKAGKTPWEVVGGKPTIPSTTLYSNPCDYDSQSDGCRCSVPPDGFHGLTYGPSGGCRIDTSGLVLLHGSSKEMPATPVGTGSGATVYCENGVLKLKDKICDLQ